MRVLMVANGFPTQEDQKRSIYNYRAAKELKKIVDLRVLVPRSWLPGRKFIQISEFEGIPIVTVTAPQLTENWRKTNLILYRHSVWGIISSYFKSVDIVHSVGVDFAGLLCGVWAKKSKVHHVTQFIADVNCLKSDFAGFPYFNNLSGHVHGIACNSKSLCKTARMLFPNIPNIKPIYRGVDLDRFTSDGPALGPMRDCPPIRFLFLGGLPVYSDRLYNSNTKGGETLMEAWREAESNSSPLHACLFFGGPMANNVKTKQWRANLKYPEKVFLSDEIKPEEVPAYIRGSDVVLIPSMEEGLPNLALEAAACARPVFGSNLDCISEIVVNDETGLLIPAGDVTEWTNILIHYANPTMITQVRQMGMCARKRMESDFDYRYFATHVVDLYRDAMECPL